MGLTEGSLLAHVLSCLYSTVGLRNSNEILVVVGGQYALSKVEAVDISGKNRTCPPIADYPFEEQSMGTYIDGKILVCGGEKDNRNTITDECYTYEPTNDTWNLLPNKLANTRRYGGEILLSDSQWWISGGSYSTLSTQKTSSSELFSTETESFSTFTSLPDERVGHHMLRVNDNTVVVLNDESSNRNVYSYDIPSANWTQLASFDDTYSDGFAGLVTFSNGTKRIFTGDGYGSEMYFFEEDLWTSNTPDLPSSFSPIGAGCLQFRDTFIIVSGNSLHPEIVIYDIADEEFQYLPWLLTESRRFFASTLVPNSYIGCYNEF